MNLELTGAGTDGTSLRCVLLETARPAYFSYLGPGDVHGASLHVRWVAMEELSP
jgi:hypothetical protein